MAGFIITYRFKETETSDKRRKSLNDFFEASPNIVIEEKTTSTIICKSESTLCNKNKTGIIDILLKTNKERPTDDKIFINEDVIWFFKIVKNKLESVRSIINSEANKPDDPKTKMIKKFFAS